MNNKSDGPNASHVQSVRETVIDQAYQAVMKDRNLDYGGPEQNFAVIAQLMTTYINARCGMNYPEIQIMPYDVAVMLILVKVARTVTSADKLDHWVDIAGYAACGGECAASVHRGESRE